MIFIFCLKRKHLVTVVISRCANHGNFYFNTLDCLLLKYLCCGLYAFGSSECKDLGTDLNTDVLHPRHSVCQGPPASAQCPRPVV